MPRASWNGFLRLSLVTCPFSLAPATTESKRIRFNQLNVDTGNRLRQQLVDAETGEVVERDRPAAPLPWPRSFRPAVANDANLMIPKDAALILSSALPFLATRSRTNF